MTDQGRVRAGTDARGQAEPHLGGHGRGEAHHGHSHGLVDSSIARSREGVKAVAVSLGVLGATALIQTVIFFTSGSVALLADLDPQLRRCAHRPPVGRRIPDP